MAKQTNAFQKCIKEYLDKFASKDEYFKEKYEDKRKSIENCCNYIINQVKKMNVCGISDDEVFQLARHYYLEEIEAKETKSVQGVKVVVNKNIEAKGTKDFEEEDNEEEDNEPVKPVIKNPEPVKSKKTETTPSTNAEQLSLF